MNRWLFLPAALCAAAAQAALPEGIAGPWFNPGQSGHGLSINLAERGSRGVVLWHVYDPDGAPLTLYVDAVVEGRDLVGPAYAPRGMRFGEFDPDDIELPEWGTVRIRFNDCDNATLSWDAVDPAYADGETAIQRLARIDSLDCTMAVANTIPGGLYVGTSDRPGDNTPDAALGIVDREGRLWGLGASPEAEGLRIQDIPSRSYLSSQRPLVFFGTPVAAQANDLFDVEMRVLEPEWARQTSASITGLGTWQATPTSLAQFEEDLGTRPIAVRTWVPASEAQARLVSPVDLAMLEGAYTFELRGQFFPFVFDLSIDGDGRVSFDGHEGWISTHEGEYGLLDFSFQPTASPRLRPFTGRGWVDDSALGRRMVLVGSNGSNGFALVATRKEASR